jgi:hypothetical protein
MDQRSLVSLEVAQQLADVVFQARYPCHVVYMGTLHPAAQSREFASASRPTPVPQAPFRALQSTNRLAGQIRISRAKAAGRLQRVLEAHRGMPPVEHHRGIRQCLALHPPQPGVPVA